jgi:FMN reductase
MSTVVLVGNPKPRSRTYTAAIRVTHRLTGSTPDEVVDLADLGTGLLCGGGDPSVAVAAQLVSSADLLVVASPTFKASYSGLLKLFLDTLRSGALDGVTAIPLMLGASTAHSLAPELLLRPLLVELGASVPTRALYLIDTQWDDDDATAAWAQSSRALLRLSGLIADDPHIDDYVIADDRRVVPIDGVHA